jgi:hypothetical protein
MFKKEKKKARMPSGGQKGHEESSFRGAACIGHEPRRRGTAGYDKR